MGNPYADLAPSAPTRVGPAWGEEPYVHDDPLYRQDVREGPTSDA